MCWVKSPKKKVTGIEWRIRLKPWSPCFYIEVTFFQFLLFLEFREKFSGSEYFFWDYILKTRQAMR